MLAEVILAPFAYLNVDQGFFCGSGSFIFPVFLRQIFLQRIPEYCRINLF